MVLEFSLMPFFFSTTAAAGEILLYHIPHILSREKIHKNTVYSFPIFILIYFNLILTFIKNNVKINYKIKKGKVIVMRDIEKIFDEIVGVCQNFCDENGINVLVEIHEEFEYYRDGYDDIDDSVVGITLISDYRDKSFMENAFNRGLQYDCGNFMMSFFHEIGHHYTMDKISKKQQRIIKKWKHKLDSRKDKDNYKHYNIIDEVLATNWAITYINNNKELIRNFAENLIPLIAEIKNELED